MNHPKRLIEVDLPIKRISAHARREKSIRHGHISTLHIWWARRPLAACRAVICAALWFDPCDEKCPTEFRDAVREQMRKWGRDSRGLMSAESYAHFEAVQKKPAMLDDNEMLRTLLLDFIADFANWDNSTKREYLETSRALTGAAHLAAGGEPGTRPLVVDPFAGGGAIPLEALRVGADAFASDLNPVAVLLNKVVLEYIPRYACLPAGRGSSVPTPEQGKFYVYILECADGSLYKGQTDNVPRRLKQHEAGEVEWTASRRPVKLVYSETFNSRQESVEREKYLKSGSGREWLKLKLEELSKPTSLADEVRKWGAWVKAEAEKELAEFYPKDPDGATPIAYLWARTIVCEGVNCGAEVPLIRSLWLAKGGRRSTALRILPKQKDKRVDFEIVQNAKASDVNEGTVKRGGASCPVCGYTTPVTSVRKQLKAKQGGAHDARLFCIVTRREDEQGRFFRLPIERDLQAALKAKIKLAQKEKSHSDKLSLVPDEPTPPSTSHRAVASLALYNIERFGDVFSNRQALLLTTLVKVVREASKRVEKVTGDKMLALAVQTVLACAIDREAEHSTSLCRWNSSGLKMQATFGRQALPMVWDFCESNPFGGSVGSWNSMMECVLIPFETGLFLPTIGHVERASATSHPLPDDIASAFITDPPYYDSVPYAELSDFFYVWLKRTLAGHHESLFEMTATPKQEQAIVWHPNSSDEKLEYESKMREALLKGRRILIPQGIGVVVFAHKSTSGWETQLQAMVDAGWIVTGSWPIDTEMGTRMNAMGTASLASSIHLVCRPRENADGSLRANDIGDWRDVLRELPIRIHEWMPRLAKEGVVGADAIFACLGPALEIFSRYSRVEKASGEQVTLREYLEYVWAAVAKEALTMIFAGLPDGRHGATDADVTGFEPDARLTAMWLWTLSAGVTPDSDQTIAEAEVEAESDDEETSAKAAKTTGFGLEYDAARKIAQGLGAHLEQLTQLVEVKGDKARLLSVAERTKHLFGKDDAEAPRKNAKKKDKQAKLFDTLEDVEADTGGWGDKSAPKLGDTVLDRVHQSMILFAAGRGDAMKRFLVDDGVGNDERFWRLANALSALYPTNGDEKRWVDGVLARKKGLGF